jgi:molybdopterin-guanine dinucleotide biosynthesis protein A
LRDGLLAFLGSGQRKVERWAAQNRCVQVVFDDAGDFANANTAQELQALHGDA